MEKKAAPPVDQNPLPEFLETITILVRTEKRRRRPASPSTLLAINLGVSRQRTEESDGVNWWFAATIRSGRALEQGP